jgi:hypothetical protein
MAATIALQAKSRSNLSIRTPRLTSIAHHFGVGATLGKPHIANGSAMPAYAQRSLYRVSLDAHLKRENHVYRQNTGLQAPLLLSLQTSSAYGSAFDFPV